MMNVQGCLLVGNTRYHLPVGTNGYVRRTLTAVVKENTAGNCTAGEKRRKTIKQRKHTI